jgi:hypothetical protein
VYLQGSDSTITEVQDFFAFFDTIPGSVHKNYRDLWMDYRTFGPQGMVTMSYVWNGKKYVWDKCIAAGGFPYDTLVARKLIDPSKTSENYPFVDWMGSEE